MSILQAVLIGLVGLILTPGYLFYFDVTPKVVVLLAGTAVVLLAGVRGRTVAPTDDERRSSVPLARSFTILLMLNGASLILSTALSSHVALSVFGGTWRRFGLVTQVAVMLFAWMVSSHCTGRPRAVVAILRAIAVCGVVCSCYGIAQYFGWDPWVPRAAYHIGEGIWTIVRPPGTLGYASYFATWLLATVFLSLALAAMEENSAWRGVGYSAAGLEFAAMVLTGTRAALVAAAAGFAVWLYWRGFRVSRRVLGAVVATVVLGAAFYYSPPGQQMRSRTRWFAEDPWGGARLLLWRDSLTMAAHRLPAGYGPEVFYGEFPHYESKQLAQAYPDFVHESPHNMFLDALVAQGVPGLAILALICAVGFGGAWRLRRTAAGALLAAALAAAIVSQQLTAFTMPTALLFFVVVALVLALAEEAGTEEPVGRRKRLPHNAVAVFSFAAPLIAVGLVYVAVRLVASDHALADVKHAIDAGKTKVAAEEYAAYDRWRLPGSSADLWYSRALIELAHKTTDMTVLQEAVQQAEYPAYRATLTSEDSFNAWYNLAEVYALSDNYTATEKSLRRAIEAHPKWFKPHWTLAQVLQMQSRLDEAELEASLAVELDGGKHAEVRETLEAIRGRK